MTTQPYISIMTVPNMPGFRVWFDNCGSEPHFYPEVDESIMESFNEVRPWTAEDDEELREWLEFQKPVCTDCGVAH